jgi:hypothetical protein
MVKHLTSKHEAPSLNTSNTHTHTHTHTRARAHAQTNKCSSHSIPRCIPREMKTCPHDANSTNVHNSIMHSRQSVETLSVFTNRQKM